MDDLRALPEHEWFCGEQCNRIHSRLRMFVSDGNLKLHIPREFPNSDLPTCNTPIKLVDEHGDEYIASYLLKRRGLSAGWTAFSKEHQLRKEDIVIFGLIDTCKLQVHIVLENELDVAHPYLGFWKINWC
ncbi:B3 domain-containing protein Os06g0194400-like [Andrographis paniculata]|uniref:B3 domain-containing protein Os06g0194400-like n=1 Tax=Andrographis paniculata TaxID=175694 RepID=UPI0021E8479C|nr:B3 domain-containing protein Os06g0194400-like [Andrographis paniculata]XP_051114247.1 B3 domain-containing protein Os06g0194400-like [Andrographis paniculata]